MQSRLGWLLHKSLRFGVGILLFCSPFSHLLHAVQTDSSALFDPPPTAGMTDLAQTPWWLSIFKTVGLSLTNQALAQSFTRDFNSLRDRAQNELAGSKQGYLLKVESYVSPEGIPIIPSGQIVFPIGVGNQPIDALANYMRLPQIAALPPSNSIDQSYYIWLKQRDGKLTGGIIPRKFRSELEREAHAEAKRLAILSDAYGGKADGGIQEMKRAEYWNEVAVKYTDYLDSEERKRQVRGLTKEFAAAQTRFNETYKKYQDTVAEMGRVQNYNRTLSTISSVTGLLSSAIQVGSVVCANEPTKAPRTDGTPSSDVHKTIEYSVHRYNYLTGEYESLKGKVVIEGNDLQKKDQKIQEIYRSGKTNIGDPGGLVIPKL